MNNPTVSVIVATMATPARAAALERALTSLNGQLGAKALPIVVVNGPSRDREVMEWLSRRQGLLIFECEEGNLPKALAYGRAAVETEFFSILDDDDEYLPDALAIRLSAMARADGADVVVTSGFRNIAGTDEACLPNIESFGPDPLGALLDQNWLPSCAGLFRTASVGAEYLERMPKYLEWTYLAFMLALQKHVTFVGKPTYRIYTDTPDSLSKSRPMLLGTPNALARVLELDLPPRVKHRIEEKLRAALHHAADSELKEHRLISAWNLHWKSLDYGRGLRYLPFTRHFIRVASRLLLRGVS